MAFSNRLPLFAICLSALTLLAIDSTPCLATDQVVTNCSSDSDLRTKLTAMQGSGGGTLTFNCGPSNVLIVLTNGLLPSITATSIIDGGNKITISGNNAWNIFRNEPGVDFTVKNITLTKGFLNGQGGAITALGPLHVFNSKFIDNHAVTGGAIYLTDTAEINDSEFALNTGTGAGGGALNIFGFFAPTGPVSITNCSFHDNQATAQLGGYGGAVYIGLSRVDVIASTFTKNKASFGGGLAINTDGIANVSDTTFDQNTASSSGGGIYNSNSIFLTNSTLKENHANTDSGGGLINYSPDAGGGDAIATITNTTFSGNSTALFGGAITNYNSRVVMTASTLVGNIAQYGSGIVHHTIFAGRQFDIANSVFANDLSAENCYVIASQTSIVSTGFDYSTDSTCATTASRRRINPLLGPLADNGGFTLTHLPLPGSPLIDSATGAQCSNVDQRGISRPQGAACDVGSVEVIPATPTPTPNPTASATPTPAPTSIATPLPSAVFNAQNLVNEASGLVRTAKKLLPGKPTKSLSKARRAKINARRKAILSSRKTLKSDVAQLQSLALNSGTEIRTFIAAFTDENLKKLKTNVSKAISKNESSPRDAKKFWKQVNKIFALLLAL